ncbi:FtsK/SpoIIIE domain-containing protein [Virgibacillus salexigens]|uniref:FtsK/SpoIIIE domain-containing protein n=1 Tax=Virgibacillus salexigens TaxID=61016 RepID=UPI001F1863E3|nr:FtsK/SpoIIIE domain-containing protein [Virgibacillus salexigens]
MNTKTDSRANVRVNRGANMDLLIGSGMAAFTIYAAAKWNKTDKEKIQHTFSNLNYKIRNKEPKHLKTHRTDQYTLYTYHVPYGLVDDEKLQVLEKVLDKPVKVSFAKGKLHIKVYNKRLGMKYPYDLFKPKGNWTIPIGMSQDGLVYHDFDHIPHMTVAGATTQGKTQFMKMFVAHLIENNPEGVEFYILDLKGKLAFNKYRNLKQVRAVVGNYRDSGKVLKQVKKSIQKDMDYLLSIEAENAKEGNIKTRKFIIVDEAGELQTNKYMSDADKESIKQCHQVLSHIARVAGQLRYSLIFGTQYPTKEILDSQIKANSLAKVSFRLSTAVQSGVALDQTGAEKLDHVGRAIYKTVEEHIVQAPFISTKDIWQRIGRYNDVSPTAKTTERRTDTVEFG